MKKGERRIHRELLDKFSSHVASMLEAYIKAYPDPTASNRFYQIMYYNEHFGERIKYLCKFFGVTRSRYYKWKQNKDISYNKELEIVNMILYHDIQNMLLEEK